MPRETKPSAEASSRVVAITGAFGSLGRQLIRRLEDDVTIERIVAIDIRSAMDMAEREGESTDPAEMLEQHARVSAHQLDLTAPGAARELAEILENEEVGALAHLAMLSTPTHHREMAHELETIGTMYVLHAVAAAGVDQLVHLSSAMCYGAHHDNPAWLHEEAPLRGVPNSRFVQDKIDADQQVQRFAEQHGEVRCSIARLGAVAGSRARRMWARVFYRPVVPAVLGYDPLFQLLHAEDAVTGLHSMLERAPEGVFNLVGRGVLPLSHIVRALGRRSLPLPAGVARGALGALWSSQVGDLPASLLDYVRWSWVCDGSKLERELGFTPSRTTTDVVALLGGHALREAA
jgi:UDP-glucose 4-epimerase